MKMCVDNKQRFHYIKVKIIGESIRLSVLEQPSRICDSLCKNRILDFQVLRDPITCSTISNALRTPFGTNDQSKKLAFLAKEESLLKVQSHYCCVEGVLSRIILWTKGQFLEALGAPWPSSLLVNDL